MEPEVCWEVSMFCKFSNDFWVVGQNIMKNDKDRWHIWSSTCRHFFQKRFDIFVLVAVFISRYSFWLFRVPPLFRGHRNVTKWFSFDMCRMRSSAECWPGALGCWGRLNWVANRWGDFFVICYPILNESWIFGCQSKPNGSNTTRIFDLSWGPPLCRDP